VATKRDSRFNHDSDLGDLLQRTISPSRPTQSRDATFRTGYNCINFPTSAPLPLPPHPAPRASPLHQTRHTGSSTHPRSALAPHTPRPPIVRGHEHGTPTFHMPSHNPKLTPTCINKVLSRINRTACGLTQRNRQPIGSGSGAHGALPQQYNNIPRATTKALSTLHPYAAAMDSSC